MEDVEGIHMLSWELGLKAVAIYRDNCKVGQPLSTGNGGEKDKPAERGTGDRRAHRRDREDRAPAGAREAAPHAAQSRTFEFRVADCKGFVTVGEYGDGRPGELFIRVSKQGSTLAGIMDAFAISISHGLQYGVPLRAFVETFTNMRFEPAGMTDDPDIRFASSIMDYLFRRLALEYLTPGRAGRAGHLLGGRAPAAHAARRRGDGHRDRAGPRHRPRPQDDPVGVRSRRPDRGRSGGLATAPLRRPAPASDAPICMTCGVHHAPGRQLLRLPELRQHQRLQLSRPWRDATVTRRRSGSRSKPSSPPSPPVRS